MNRPQLEGLADQAKSDALDDFLSGEITVEYLTHDIRGIDRLAALVLEELRQVEFLESRQETLDNWDEFAHRLADIGNKLKQIRGDHE